MKFRKKPVVVEAFQLPAAGDDNTLPFFRWAEAIGFTNFTSGSNESLIISTLEGDMRADAGDWIIRGVANEFYPCKPEIFAATYEPADQPDPQQTEIDRLRGIIARNARQRLDDTKTHILPEDIAAGLDILHAHGS